MPSILTRGLGFAPYYLVTRGLGPLVAPAATLTAPYRDRPILAFMAAALAATGQFDVVKTDGLPKKVGLGADESAVACLELTGFENDFDALGDDTDSATPQVRVVTFTLTLIARHNDSDACRDTLWRLEAEAENAVNKQSFGGQTLPTQTCLLRGQLRPADGVEQRLTVDGQYAYILDDWDAHNTDPDD